MAVASTPGRLAEVVVQQSGQGNQVVAAFLEADAARSYVDKRALRVVGDVSLLAGGDEQTQENGATRIERRSPGLPGKLLACYSPRGGAGTSLLAAALASHAANACSLSTLLIDLDLQNGSQAFFFDITDARRHSIMGLKPLVDEVVARCEGDLDRVAVEAAHVVSDEILLSRTFAVDERLRVLCALDDPAAIDDYADPGTHMEALLAIVSTAFDVVVVDVPNTVDVFTAPALFRADRIALVSLDDVPSQVKVARMLNLMLGPMIQARGLDVRQQCLLTMCRTNRQRLDVPMPIPVAATIPEDARYADAALNRRQSLSRLADTPYARAVGSLAAALGLAG